MHNATVYVRVFDPNNLNKGHQVYINNCLFDTDKEKDFIKMLDKFGIPAIIIKEWDGELGREIMQEATNDTYYRLFIED